jgi:hypothetical protein
MNIFQFRWNRKRSTKPTSNGTDKLLRNSIVCRYKLGDSMVIQKRFNEALEQYNHALNEVQMLP